MTMWDVCDYATGKLLYKTEQQNLPDLRIGILFNSTETNQWFQITGIGFHSKILIVTPVKHPQEVVNQ